MKVYDKNPSKIVIKVNGQSEVYDALQPCMVVGNFLGERYMEPQGRGEVVNVETGTIAEFFFSARGWGTKEAELY